MPNKEKEPEPLAKIMSSDPRHFEIDLIQREIIMAVQAQLAHESILTGQSEPQDFVVGMRTDAAQVPMAEMAMHVQLLKERQIELLQMNPEKYVPTPGIQLLQDFIAGKDYLTNRPTEAQTFFVESNEYFEEEEGAWPVGRDDDEWDRLFSASVFASLEFDFGKSIV